MVESILVRFELSSLINVEKREKRDKEKLCLDECCYFVSPAFGKLILILENGTKVRYDV